jgi:chemosensory pili system protein ChpA (sensor histidine kinase/response regulator)
MSDRRILVIEDDIYSFEYANLLLSMEGYYVSYWPTSTGATEQIAQHQPDLILLDQRLDRSPNGWDILQALRDMATTAHIPVILYSADHAFLRSHELEIHGMGGDVLDKPFHPGELLGKVETLINPIDR